MIMEVFFDNKFHWVKDVGISKACFVGIDFIQDVLNIFFIVGIPKLVFATNFKICAKTNNLKHCSFWQAHYEKL